VRRRKVRPRVRSRLPAPCRVADTRSATGQLAGAIAPGTQRNFAVAARENDHSDTKAAAIRCVRAYREGLRDFSKKSPLETLYTRLDGHALITMATDAKGRKRHTKYVDKARQRMGEQIVPRITDIVGGRHRLIDQPPLIYHATEAMHDADVAMALEAYRLSLPDELHGLLDRYRLEDFALKVVGIGSVGTHCFIGLFFLNYLTLTICTAFYRL
jgi:hypothetical protein